MNDSILITLTNLWQCLPWFNHKEKAIDILAAFTLDTEHELISVITALQAHIDLLRYEQSCNSLPIGRFNVLDRAITRLIKDATVLVSLSELAKSPQSKHELTLKKLMEEIATETYSAFKNSQVSLSYDIAKGTTLIGDIVSLKDMFTRIILVLLHSCHKLETLKIIGLTNKKRVSVSFDIGIESNNRIFKPWKLGELRLIPINGEGISLSAVDAMARLHHGQLSMSTLLDQRHGYKLSFSV